MKRAAIVVTLAGARDELLDMLGRFVGCKLKAESAEVGGHDGLDFVRRQGSLAPSRARRAEQQPKQVAARAHGRPISRAPR